MSLSEMLIGKLRCHQLIQAMEWLLAHLVPEQIIPVAFQKQHVGLYGISLAVLSVLCYPSKAGEALARGAMLLVHIEKSYIIRIRKRIGLTLDNPACEDLTLEHEVVYTPSQVYQPHTPLSSPREG
jgi:hypothetical protein